MDSAHVDDARRALYLDRHEDGARQAYVYSGNSDSFFFKDIQNMYSGIKRDFERNMYEASVDYQMKTDNKLFEILSNVMNVPRSEITFFNLAKYLDDYIWAKENDRPLTPFYFDQSTNDMISEYFTYYFKHGMLRDPALNKVVAHPFLFSLLREIMFKAQPSSEFNKWEGAWVTSKVSLSFGNQLTFFAALEMLNFDKDIDYIPRSGKQLTFELFEIDNEFFIRIYINNKLMTLLARDGVIPLNYFIDYVWSRLYQGNVEGVEEGTEDYHSIANAYPGKCQSFTQTVPLFGWSKKKQYSFDQTHNYEFGWTQDTIKKSDSLTKYGNGKLSDTVIFIDSDQKNHLHPHSIIQNSLLRGASILKSHPSARSISPYSSYK